ncbi:MAG: NUDIX domain-containing protein [Pseudomonadota bacterium]
MFSRILLRVLQPWFRLRRGMTLGVRIVVLDSQNQVFLVRHGYAPGWLLPGGGVERGQTLYDAVERELAEEGGIMPGERPLLHGVFSNEAKFRGDHVACFVLRNFTRRDWTPTLEIKEARFFPVTALPQGTTGGTRRRIAEVLEGRIPPASW